MNRPIFLFLLCIKRSVDSLHNHLLILGREAVNLVLAALVISLNYDVSVGRTNTILIPILACVLLASLLYNILSLEHSLALVNILRKYAADNRLLCVVLVPYAINISLRLYCA